MDTRDLAAMSALQTDIDTSPPPAPAAAGLALEACEITKRYGSRLVLDRASLSVAAGESIAIIGENGAGKSTLLRICAGLIRPDGGEVKVRGRLGYCPQQPGLFDLLSADEHLALLAPALGIPRAQAIAEGHALLAEFAFPV